MWGFNNQDTIAIPTHEVRILHRRMGMNTKKACLSQVHADKQAFKLMNILMVLYKEYF